MNYVRDTIGSTIFLKLGATFSSTLETQTSGVTCEPHGYLELTVQCMWTVTVFVCKKKEAAITMLKILCGTAQNLDAWVLSHLGFMHVWYKENFIG